MASFYFGIFEHGPSGKVLLDVFQPRSDNQAYWAKRCRGMARKWARHPARLITVEACTIWKGKSRWQQFLAVEPPHHV